jgi:hypothetical protein
VRTYILVAVLTLSSLVARVAEARHVRFAGPHPIAAKFGGGYCYIQAPHLHIYGPDHPNLYQQNQGEYQFTGDPTPFGYDGEKYPYYGHHPVVSVGGEPVYCYINGPHFHAEAPPGDGYKMKNGVAFYVGPFAPGYATMKPQRVRMVNAEYRPYAQYRPTVQVEPPPEWHGEVYVPGPPSVEVSAPGIEINAPAPPGVVVQAPPPPGVVVSAPRPRVVVAPPPPPGVVVTAPAPRVVVAPPPPPGVVVTAPAPHVVIGAPPPPHVVIGAPAPRVYVAPAPGPVYVTPGKVHHDHGKHKGWYK